MTINRSSALEHVWAQEAASAIAEHKVEAGRLELAIAIAAQLCHAVRSGASGPFALWTRSQLLAMSSVELIAALLCHVDQETIRMHLAGCFVAQLRKRLSSPATEEHSSISDQLRWTIDFFENADASPDYTFVTSTSDEVTGEDLYSQPERTIYCEVLLANIVWKRDRLQAA